MTLLGLLLMLLARFCVGLLKGRGNPVKREKLNVLFGKYFSLVHLVKKYCVNWHDIRKPEVVFCISQYFDLTYDVLF